MRKFKLDDLKVSSFVTAHEVSYIKGGEIGVIVPISYRLTNCGTYCLPCPKPIEND